MGVPKFFRWISERYPCLSTSIENNEVPSFDCLYLDMNGIIHICSHPDDSNVQFRISEYDIFSNIFKYIEFLFKTVKPLEVFFLAVDGVAPRAKMNQQRARRFKSAKEAIGREFAAMQSGIKLPDEKRFDSNAITPGTEFMHRLQNALISFINNKVQNDVLWQGVDIILSGHETPGEGEHKIQEFIRYRKTLPNYNPYTRHCLYGLDADLILLGLASHEPFFSLLREEVTFTKKKMKRAYIAEETRFFLLHLSLLREYIDCEFNSLKMDLENAYNLESIIDDWVVMTFLVGNDFIPHLPNLHIHSSALPLLWETYIKVRPKLIGYINENGKLNLENLLFYLKELSIFDRNTFEDINEDAKWMQSKASKKIGEQLQNLGLNKSNVNDDLFLTSLFQDTPEICHEDDLLNECKDLDELSCLDDIELNMSGLSVNESPPNVNVSFFNNNEHGDEDNEDLFELEYRHYRRNYYYSKLGLNINEDILAEQAKEYFTALQWISYYYFHGVPSWEWFYPQHYAPFMSDLEYLSDSLKQNGIHFEIGRPFLPFEQLMAVLPAESCELLPKCFQCLMTEESSPIIDFYPKTFKTDLNGKKKEWEAVVLIPFIDEKRLLETLETKISLLTDLEAERNVHGPHLKFRCSGSNFTRTEINSSVFRIPESSIVFGIYPTLDPDVNCDGFPSFKHIKHDFALDKAFVKCFEFSSNNASMVLKISPPTSPLIGEEVARKFINEITYVDWPVFKEIKVVAVLDESFRYSFSEREKKIVKDFLSDSDKSRFKAFKEVTHKNLYKRSAIQIYDNDLFILETHHFEGKRYKILELHKAGSTIALEPHWKTDETFWHLHQLAVLKKSIDFRESNLSRNCSKLSQFLSKDTLVFSLDSKFYGQSGSVVSINHLKKLIKVNIQHIPESDLLNIDELISEPEYLSTTVAAEMVGLDALLFSRITGSLFINLHPEPENQNKVKRCEKNKSRCSIGLDLKDNKSDVQIPDWVIKNVNSDHKWCYSNNVIRLVQEYQVKFPEIFEFIKKPNFEKLSMDDIFNESDSSTKLKELNDFLSNLPHRNLEKVKNDSIIISGSNIKCLQNSPIKSHAIEKTVEIIFDEIYRCHRSLNGVIPDPSTTYELLDRVVCCTGSYTVPMGVRGYVIGIHHKHPNDFLIEVLFDKEFPSAISVRGSEHRCYRMPRYTLINISHGKRKCQRSSPKSHMNINNCRAQSRKEDLVSNVSPMVINTLTTSDIQNNPGSSKKSKPIESFPKPSRELLLDRPISQKNFIAHCADIFLHQEPPQDHVYTISSIQSQLCPPEYHHLFFHFHNYGLCPQIIERFHSGNWFVNFSCSLFSLPFLKELNRLRIVKLAWETLYTPNEMPSLWDPSPRNGRRKSSPGQIIDNGFMNDQFIDNPFLQMCPQQYKKRSPIKSPMTHNSYTMMSNETMSAGNQPKINNNCPEKVLARGSQKKFISAPKPRKNLFKGN